MHKTAVYNQVGDKISEMELNPKIFGLEKIDASLVHDAVRIARTNQRHAISHTKMQGEVSGSGKKPWKQKGTGRARAGSIRSPLWRHGGIIFGPRNVRNWSRKMNKSAFRKALFTVLTDKVNDNKLAIVDNLPPTAKSKELAIKLSNLAMKAGFGHKYVLVLAAHNKDLERAARNLQNVKVLFGNQLSLLDLMKGDTLVMKDALPVIEKTYLK